MAKTASRAEREVVTKDDPLVEVRISRKGAGKVSTGQHVPTEGDVYFEADETASLPFSVAQALEDRGYVVLP